MVEHYFRDATLLHQKSGLARVDVSPEIEVNTFYVRFITSPEGLAFFLGRLSKRAFHYIYSHFDI